jgi:hypothetical protein
MSSNSRFTDQQIVNSFNLFIDTEKASVVGDGSSKGDDVNIHFEGSTIVAGDGEMIRLTLTNFEMFNNFYNIDINNSKFQTRMALGTAPTPNPTERDIPRKNYGTYGDVVYEFANVIGNAIETALGNVNQQVLVADIKNVFVESGLAGESSNPFPLYNVTTKKNWAYPVSPLTAFTELNTLIKPTSLGLGNTSDRTIDITYQVIGTSNNAHVHNFTKFHIQCLSSFGDAYAVLGGLRQDDSADNSFNSFQIDLNPNATSTQIRVRGYFPVQRMSDPYVYLRCTSAQNGGLEMTVLSDSAVTSSSNNSDITTSNIFAKLKKDVEFISYDNGIGDEFFMNLQQRKLSSLRFTLTDSKNRKIGRKKDDNNSGTGAGRHTGTDSTGAGLEYTVANSDFSNKNQSTLGNLFFTAVVRVDIIKMSNPTKLETTPLPLALPARKAQSGVISFSDLRN